MQTKEGKKQPTNQPKKNIKQHNKKSRIRQYWKKEAQYTLTQAKCNFLALMLDIISSKLVLLNLVKNKSSYNVFIAQISQTPLYVYSINM